ncbi:HEPN domain-containing protein [Propionispira arboris]|uniref:HEPN domain-containing protein n=1 Tax=Propionispira arboris TaxID=84035 RepID=A0A1H7CS90_9FIRM|nr:HEPN domain-containing protein [Propionispira arboris]SEJ92084.1 HEPN domain-containing protein [Propionispira arboris]
MINSIQNEADIDSFVEAYHTAQGFHHRAENFLQEGQANSVVFNVAAIALENYLIALSNLHGVEPRNHNYICLMDSIETFMIIPPLLSAEIRSLDVIFGICSLENYQHGTPEEEDGKRVIRLCQKVQGLFDQHKISALKSKI